MIEPFDKVRDDIISIKSELDYNICVVRYGRKIVDDMMVKYDVKIKALILKSEILNKYSISSEDYKIFHHQFIEDCKKDKK